MTRSTERAGDEGPIDAGEAPKRFARLLERVAEGESVLITRDGRPVAKLAPAEDERRKRADARIGRMARLRSGIVGATSEEIMASIHEGHRY